MPPLVHSIHSEPLCNASGSVRADFDNDNRNDLVTIDSEGVNVWWNRFEAANVKLSTRGEQFRPFRSVLPGVRTSRAVAAKSLGMHEAAVWITTAGSTCRCSSDGTLATCVFSSMRLEATGKCSCARRGF